jgi:hypothetical protein
MSKYKSREIVGTNYDFASDGMVDLTRLFEIHGNGANDLGKYLNRRKTRRVVDCLTTYYGLPLESVIRNAVDNDYNKGHIFVHRTLFMNALRHISPEQGVMLDMARSST